jgi:hypothetical protein
MIAVPRTRGGKFVKLWDMWPLQFYLVIAVTQIGEIVSRFIASMDDKNVMKICQAVFVNISISRLGLQRQGKVKVSL